MRKPLFLLMILCLFGARLGLAQDVPVREQPETLFGNEDLSVRFFGGPTMDFTMVDKEFGFMMGGGGALVFNRKVLIGGFGTGLTSEHFKELSDTSQYKLDMGFGGFWLGYISNSNKMLHFAFSAKMGFGNASLNRTNGSWSDIVNGNNIYDRIFAFIPSAEAEVNVTKYMRVNLGLGYRLISGLNKPQFGNANALNGATACLTFKFGLF